MLLRVGEKTDSCQYKVVDGCLFSAVAGWVDQEGRDGTLAHRFMYFIAVGDLIKRTPSGRMLVIDHRVCDTPDCINPEHLKLVSQQKNALRGRGHDNVDHLPDDGDLICIHCGAVKVEVERTVRGARVAAIFYSLIESAKLAGVEPSAYIREATRRAIEAPGTVTLPADLTE